MSDKIKLPFSFDPGLLKNDLNGIGSEEWIGHFNKANYEGVWSVVPLRGPKGATHPVQQIVSLPGTSEYEDTSYMERCPNIKEAVYTLKCPFTSIRLMSLHAGSIIKEHRDYMLGLDFGEVRIHIPVKTNDNVIFLLKGERVKMLEGEMWYLDLSKPHAIENKSSEERIHIVIDCVVNDWLKELIE